MRTEGEPNNEQRSFATVLKQAMEDPNYFVDVQPEGEDWSKWEGYNYRDVIGTWLIAEKFFMIPTARGEGPYVRIIQPNSSQFTMDAEIDGRTEKVEVLFVLDIVNSKKFKPVIFVCQDSSGKEIIMRRETDRVALESIPGILKEIAGDFGDDAKFSRVVQDTEGDEWAAFLKSVLERKTVEPIKMRQKDNWTRKVLIGMAEEYGVPPEKRIQEGELTEEDRLLASSYSTEQELLMYAFASLVIPEKAINKLKART